MNDPDFKELKFTPISDYGWEESGENHVKIYVTKNFENIKQECRSDNIECKFETQSFDLKEKDWKGKNWRLRIEKLFGGIAVEWCKCTVKSNSISITLKK